MIKRLGHNVSLPVVLNYLNYCILAFTTSRKCFMQLWLQRAVCFVCLSYGGHCLNLSRRGMLFIPQCQLIIQSLQQLYSLLFGLDVKQFGTEKKCSLSCLNSVVDIETPASSPLLQLYEISEAWLKVSTKVNKSSKQYWSNCVELHG